MSIPLSHFVPASPSPSLCPQVHSLCLRLYSCPAAALLERCLTALRLKAPVCRSWSQVGHLKGDSASPPPDSSRGSNLLRGWGLSTFNFGCNRSDSPVEQEWHWWELWAWHKGVEQPGLWPQEGGVVKEVRKRCGVGGWAASGKGKEPCPVEIHEVLWSLQDGTLPEQMVCVLGWGKICLEKGFFNKFICLFILALLGQVFVAAWTFSSCGERWLLVAEHGL